MAQSVITPKTAYSPRLKSLYIEQIAPSLKEELKLKNINQVPKLVKITINVGLGRAQDEKKLLEVASNTLSKISGQQPIGTKAKSSIAGFKLREGSQIGLKATLRGDRMYEFADRLINLILPRLRDFHGVNPKSFDAQGNFNLGLSDQSVFPELTYEETTTSHGLQIVFVISGQGPEHSRVLLEKLGMPFAKESR
jgi:large subunit ribosomal protein L5